MSDGAAEMVGIEFAREFSLYVTHGTIRYQALPIFYDQWLQHHPNNSYMIIK